MGRGAIKNLPNCPSSPKLLQHYGIMIAGITGGLGCGKSTVARLLEQRNFRRLDSDRIVREQILTDPEIVAALRDRYGESITEKESSTAAPAINRTALATRVFANDGERV